MVLRVAQSVLDTLERARPQRGLGWLIGFVTPAATHVLSVAKANDISVDAVHDLVSVDTLQIEQSLDSLFGTLPYGIQILGPLVFSSKVDKDTKSVVSEVALLSKPLIQNKWQIMEYQEIDGYAGSWNGELQILNATSLLNEDFATSSGDPPAHVFKVFTKIPIYLEKNAVASNGWIKCTADAFSNLEELWSPSVFQGCLLDSSSKTKFIFQPGCVGDVKNLSSSPNGWIEVSAGCVKSPTKEAQSLGTLQYQTAKVEKNWEVLWREVSIDFLAYFDQATHLGDIGSKLQVALIHTVRYTGLKHAQHQESPKFGWYHFAIPDMFHHISLLHPVGIEEEDLCSHRKKYHQMFLLDEDKPLFRISCALNQDKTSSTVSKGARLRDVHKSVKSPGVDGGTIAVVDGSYDYCHYMQDKFDDNGWGCAYRSLQTVFSWFLRQHYTNKRIPSHREIQETLVDIGDKEPSFIGSREWIGSIEVGFVLDELLNVGHRVVMKRAEQEPTAVAKDLLHHFQTEGTPVSIGGGVLAYTLLGVQYNEVTGDVAFLILDPHYTGEDDVERICRGGWIAWKKPTDKAAAGGPLFAPNTFYNFMCPKRPRVI